MKIRDSFYAAIAGSAVLAVSAIPVARAANSLGLTYSPVPSWFQFQSPATVNGWISNQDTQSISGHGWMLWGAVTAPTTQNVGGTQVTVPTFETWYDEDTVFSPPSASHALATGETGRKFKIPQQLLRGGALKTLADVSPLDFRVVTVKYTQEIYDGVQQNQYYSGTVMQQLNNGWGSAPLANRKIADFSDRAIMVKPVYQVISGTEATQIPYWAGAENSSTPATPGPSTWTQKALIVPPGVTPGASTLPAVGLDRFYAVKLDQTEVNYLVQAGAKSVKVGDYAVLVGMHLSSREIDNWTWQTYWWSYQKPSIPASAGGHVQAPFDNYAMATGYSFTTEAENPNSLATVCFNPYLEAGFGNKVFEKPQQLGIESNCMSCHRAAAWPGSTGKYIANGLIDASDPFFFTGNTKTDFVWALPEDVQTPTAGK
jgi:hypothetical protein